MFQDDFFSHEPESLTAYRNVITSTLEALLDSLPQQPFVGGGPAEVEAQVATTLCPPKGKDWDTVLDNLQAIAANSVAIWHPHTAAHLQFPVLIPALGAELALSALNASMDSFDQAPSATIVEELTLKWLAELVGLPETAAGTISTGGTQSNYMALLLARDHYLATRRNWRALQHGLPPDSGRLRILCSEIAHFSVEKSAIQLGLGTEAVVKIPVDGNYRMQVDALETAIEQLRLDDLEPFAVVATAGTTDFGSFDPVAAIGKVAAAAGIWFHVDAAYGGAYLLSEKQRGKLAGIERADSVTLDFHKAFFQPISCGAFLVREASRFDLIRLYADYLNPESYDQDGIPNLVTRSLLTTRRFDALKIWMCMQAIGQDKFARMVERLNELAQFAAQEIQESGVFEALHQPEFGCLVFRYLPAEAGEADRINEAIPRRLFEAGEAVIGHTVINGQHCLKLTLNNPAMKTADLTSLLALIEEYGRKLEVMPLGVHELHPA